MSKCILCRRDTDGDGYCVNAVCPRSKIRAIIEAAKAKDAATNSAGAATEAAVVDEDTAS
jgi:ferredoxin